MPRSGTTLIFEAFGARPDIAWLSPLLQRMPWFPAVAMVSRLADVTPALRQSVSRTDQQRPWANRLRIGPVEAFGFWEHCCGTKFRYDYLLAAEASSEEAKRVQSRIAGIVRYHGKQRFAAKLTGPGRISFLSSIFPDARFVHVVRDGRAVVRSLLRVPFWRRRDRMVRPAWDNGLVEADFVDWRRYHRSPLALAAVQWRRVVESTRMEAERIAPDRYAEVHYERFVGNPAETLDSIAAFCGLPPAPEAREFLRARFELRDMDFQWREELQAEEIQALQALVGRTLRAFGYEVSPSAGMSGGPLLEVPFREAAPESNDPPPGPIGLRA
jgi:hypothetical protein